MRFSLSVAFVSELLAAALLAGVTLAHDGPHASPIPAEETAAAAEPASPGSSLAGGTIGPDVAFCQFYGLQQFGRLGSVVGLAAATTSWNVGTEDLIWFQSPDPRHPFIAQNLYRLKDDRFEHIGQSWVKHAFYALNDEQCGTDCTYEPGHGVGLWLGVGCTDTYSQFLNADQTDLGPREEINPWTGVWNPSGSHNSTSHSHSAIAHRLQVNDADLNPATNAGATYLVEGYYVHLEDMDVMNSAAWKTVTVSGSPGGIWSFGMSGFSVKPQSGFAIDAWAGATKTVIAEELPVNELSSPDGRSILAAKATDMGGGVWHYEYALLNVDMNRKINSFSVPISPGKTAVPGSIGFHAPLSHNESYSNTPWTSEVSEDCPVGERCITWSTTTNPIRWGTVYNFRFDIDSPPAGARGASPGMIAVGLHEPGTPTMLTAATIAPESPGPIPAAGAWGLLALSLLLACSATIVLSKPAAA